MEENKHKLWIESAVELLCQGDNICSLHIDELYDFELSDKDELFKCGLDSFLNIVELYQNVESKDLRLELRIELNSISSEVQGVPLNTSSLIDQIDEWGMPEIVLFKKEPSANIPAIEIYTCPLPFSLTDIQDTIKIIYEEYRTIEELKEKENFTRWLSLIYNS